MIYTHRSYYRENRVAIQQRLYIAPAARLTNCAVVWQKAWSLSDVTEWGRVHRSAEDLRHFGNFLYILVITCAGSASC